MSSRTRIAPIVIAESATLKAQKWVVAPVDVDEVDHEPEHGTVDQIAERAGENEGETEPRHALVESKLGRVHGNGDQRHRRDADHHDRLVGKLDRVQQPECRAGVVHVGQVEEVRDQAAALSERQQLAHDRLGHLVERDDHGHRAELQRVSVAGG